LKGKRDKQKTIVRTPGIKAKTYGTGEKLGDERVTKYRAVVARSNYLAQDRSNIQNAAKELCRNMANLHEGDWTAAKRLGRYLLSKPRFEARYDHQRLPGFMQVWVDTDFAGCMRTRKSTSGRAIMFGDYFMTSWSTPPRPRLHYIVGRSVKGSCQGSGMKSFLGDL